MLTALIISSSKWSFRNLEDLHGKSSIHTLTAGKTTQQGVGVDFLTCTSMLIPQDTDHRRWIYIYTLRSVFFCASLVIALVVRVRLRSPAR